jgi:hypothetical protein
MTRGQEAVYQSACFSGTSPYQTQPMVRLSVEAFSSWLMLNELAPIPRRLPLRAA